MLKVTKYIIKDSQNDLIMTEVVVTFGGIPVCGIKEVNIELNGGGNNRLHLSTVDFEMETKEVTAEQFRKYTRTGSV